MNMALKQRENCLVSVALLAVLLAMLFLLLEPLWLRYSENKQDIADLNGRLANYQVLALQRKELESSYQYMLGQYNENGYLLKSTTRGLAIADLQSIIRKTIDQHGGRLVSTQVIKSRDDKDLKVKVRVKSEGDIQALKQILEAIEASSMILLMDNVTILKNKRPKRTRNLSRIQPLQLNFDLTAFISGEQP